MPQLITEITATDWSPKLGHIGEIVTDVDDINQCIGIILNTRKGSDPHRPLFGSNLHLYIDYPANDAIPHLVRETIDAINLWESRVKLVKVTVSVTESNVRIQVEWRFNEDYTVHLTEVLYAAA